MRASKRSSATLERQGQDRGGGSPFRAPARQAKNASQTPYKHRLAHASGSRPLAFRAGVPVRGFLGRSPKPLLGTFGGAKVPPRRTGVQIKTFYKTLRRREATTNFRHNRLQICCSLLLGGRIIGRSRNQGGALSCRSPPLTKTTTPGHFRHSPPAERPTEKGFRPLRRATKAPPLETASLLKKA